jgi:hypothetical protein
MGRKRESKKSGLLVHWPVIVFGSALIALFSTLAYKACHSAPPSPGPGSGAVPVYHDRAEDAMPFPATLEPASFKQTEVREAYQTAKEIPEVLAQQPCYCYCQRKGHRSLLDCFKTDHAASCSICIREALLAAQMHRQLKSAEEIRRAITRGPWAGEGSSNQ